MVPLHGKVHDVSVIRLRLHLLHLAQPIFQTLVFKRALLERPSFVAIITGVIVTSALELPLPDSFSLWGVAMIEAHSVAKRLGDELHLGCKGKGDALGMAMVTG